MASDSANLFREYLVIESGFEFALSSYFGELERDLRNKDEK
jgi:hypothetical protein